MSSLEAQICAPFFGVKTSFLMWCDFWYPFWSYFVGNNSSIFFCSSLFFHRFFSSRFLFPPFFLCHHVLFHVFHLLRELYFNVTAHEPCILKSCILEKGEEEHGTKAQKCQNTYLFGNNLLISFINAKKQSVVILILQF